LGLEGGDEVLREAIGQEFLGEEGEEGFAEGSLEPVFEVTFLVDGGEREGEVVELGGGLSRSWKRIWGFWEKSL
jgi:hypothetical protein